MEAKTYRKEVEDYVDSVVSGKKIAGKEVVAACERYLRDKDREDIELRTKDPDVLISVMESLLVHKQGEDLEGNSLQGKPFILSDWQRFCIYNMFGFFYMGTSERRFKEAMIVTGRKNGKTSFIAGLALGAALLQRRSGSRVYIVANALRQALEAFDFILFSLQAKGLIGAFRVHDNNLDHSIYCEFKDAEGKPDGSVEIIALAANPDAQDSFNCNFAIADEVAAYKKPAQYNRFKEAMSAYQNKMMVGITTAGDNKNSFGARRMDYAVKVATGVIEDDSFFSFVARADMDENGEVDYLDPAQHAKANPSLGVTLSPSELMTAALQAKNDPQQRKDFLSRRLNIYTTSLKAWFDLEEFRNSDGQYTWTLEELAQLPIDWYGGADLSRMHDLTAAALVGQYDGVDIIITHAFFPAVAANTKAEEDGIPVYQWLDEGWLTMCNTPTVNAEDVVKWFCDMRDAGFKIRQVGHDRKFAGEVYIPAMKKAHFSIIDQPQLYYLKSQGFRHIEKAAKDGKLYYMHSTAYEYCVGNVRGMEKVDDAVMYEKIGDKDRIDLFDASVFATIRMLKAQEKKKKARDWFGE